MQGVLFSGARIGAAFAVPVVAWMISRLGGCAVSRRGHPIGRVLTMKSRES
jgi:hypothetical protein